MLETAMLAIDPIAAQVLHNCRVADARHAGMYSICGLALGLRDLYKWEQGLPPWEERDSAEILEWIGDREEEWERVCFEEFRPITIQGRSHDPFDIASINARLESEGLIYGAGYAHGLRPTFFLAELKERREMEGLRVQVLGRELARDLLTLPALSRDACIFLRRESATLFLWDRILFARKSGRTALRFALASYGVAAGDQAALRERLDQMVADQMEDHLQHEIGELRDRVFDRDLWREIIAAFHGSPIELLARALKDLLADTQRTLPHIIEARRASSLAFYAAFLDGLRPRLFPEIRRAFEDFPASGNWQPVEQAAAAGFRARPASGGKPQPDLSGGQAERRPGLGPRRDPDGSPGSAGPGGKEPLR